MSIYKTSELLNLLGAIANDGYEFVEIYEDEADEDYTAALCFSAVLDPDSVMSFDNLDSVNIPQNYAYNNLMPIPQLNDTCGTITFTFSELFTLMDAVNNSLEYCKERLASHDCTKEERAAIKESAPELRNMQAKFAKFRKKHGIEISKS